MNRWMGLSVLGVSLACVAMPIPEAQTQAITVTAKMAEFTVTLPSNPSTGYQWFLSNYNTALITPVAYHYEANTDQKRIGAPGKTIWTFHAAKGAFVVPQTTEIDFAYARAWEAENSNIARVMVRFASG